MQVVRYTGQSTLRVNVQRCAGVGPWGVILKHLVGQPERTRLRLVGGVRAAAPTPSGTTNLAVVGIN